VSGVLLKRQAGTLRRVRRPSRTGSKGSLRALAVFGIAFCSCGDDDSTTDITAPLESLSQWCTALDVPLPMLPSATPDGTDSETRVDELEIVDLYVGRYELLSAQTPGVPEAAHVAAGDLARAFASLREQARSGKSVQSVLADSIADRDSDLFVAGVAFDRAVSDACL
jgi:hypothetical protein